MAYFQEVAEERSPGIESLVKFVDAVQIFMGAVLNLEWAEEPDQDVPTPPLFAELRGTALLMFREYLPRSFNNLRDHIPEIRADQIRAHGLTGPAQHFKLMVLYRLELSRPWIGNIWEWIRQMLQQINCILQSIIDAVAYSIGIPHGSLIREFKDSLTTLLVPAKA